MNARPAICILTLCLAACLGAVSVPVKEAYVESELVAEESAVQPGRPLQLALRMKIDKNWHTYWKNPGDEVGLPTSIEWKLPRGFAAGPIQWPVPRRYDDTPPFINYGYGGEIFLLVKLDVPQTLAPGTDVAIEGNASWLACKSGSDGICVPGFNVPFKLTLPAVAGVPPRSECWADRIAEARQHLPLEGSDWTLHAARDNDGFVIQSIPPAGFDEQLGSMLFIPAKPGMIDDVAKQPLEWTGQWYLLRVRPPVEAESLPERLSGLLVNDAGWRGVGTEKGVRIDVPIAASLLTAVPEATPVARLAAASSGDGRLGIMLLFAFLGGLILNLMPCVLPVLSLKVLGIVEQAGEDRLRVRLHGLVFALGVLISFWILAAVLIGLKAGGQALGWGFQLQSPSFVIVLATVIFLFGLSLFGIFEIGTSLIGVGASAAGQAGLTGSFFSGIFATVVATPCTAPFMGSALGFTLTQPAWVAMLVFTFLGLGLAAPYVVLSSAPALMRFIPRPGAWMESFKQFMGFLLMATVIWLVWVLGRQQGNNAAALLWAALLIMGLGAWIVGHWAVPVRPPLTRLSARVIAVVLIAGTLAAVLSTESITRPGGSRDGGVVNKDAFWQVFSTATLDELLTAGKPVFIDFTADWCITCKVNERIAFTDAVRRRFLELGIAPLKADWTHRDAVIAKVLAGYRRNGVPLYLLYPGGSDRKYVILPQILTPGIVLRYLDKHVAVCRQAAKGDAQVVRDFPE